MPLAAAPDPYQCLEVVVIKQHPRWQEAQELLQRVAKQVQPIMRKRRWTVHKLSEFSPRNPGLLGLNVNRGAEVKIRLRPARDVDSFYDWHHVLGTMLHELCHIEVSPHNASFYKLLDELWGEAEDLMDRGISGSGQGFDAASVGRLGSHGFIPTHNPPEHKMADAIRKAAEARAAKQSIMPAGPRKLGGGSSSGTSGSGSGLDWRHLAPAQAAAMAAERRAEDNVWCGAEHTPSEVQQELGEEQPTAGTSARAAAAAAAAAAAGGEKGGGPGAQGLHRGGQPPPQQRHTEHAASDAAAGAAAAAAAVASSAQQQQLQEQWQRHLRQQQQQQQQSQLQRRKRPAGPEHIDLTLSSDDDDEGAEQQQHRRSAAGAAAGDAQALQTWEKPAAACPCCAAALEGPLDTAVMQRLRARRGFRAWCELHRQQAAGVPDEWACSVCTLRNPALALVCQACLTAKDAV